MSELAGLVNQTAVNIGGFEFHSGSLAVGSGKAAQLFENTAKSGSIIYSNMYELYLIAAVVLGTSLSGG